MSEKEEAVFGPAASEFIGHYGDVRGFVRQEVVHHRLKPFLEADNARILDYGGGEALDSIWAVSHGGEVDYWDNTSAMRAKALENVSKSRAKVHMLEADPAKNTTPRYNILLLHVVLQYQQPEEQQILVERLSKALLPGGLLSLMDRNWSTVTEESGSDGEIKKFTNGLGLDCFVFPLKFWSRQLSELGFSDISPRGVRGIYERDRRSLREVDPAEQAKIAAEEINWSSNPESVKNGRLLHILAVKN